MRLWLTLASAAARARHALLCDPFHIMRGRVQRHRGHASSSWDSRPLVAWVASGWRPSPRVDRVAGATGWSGEGAFVLVATCQTHAGGPHDARIPHAHGRRPPCPRSPTSAARLAVAAMVAGLVLLVATRAHAETPASDPSGRRHRGPGHAGARRQGSLGQDAWPALDVRRRRSATPCAARRAAIRGTR